METLVVEISKEAKKLKMSAYEKARGTEHRHYSEKILSDKEIEGICNDATDLFNKANRHGDLTDNYSNELRKNTQLLYDQLLTSEVKHIIKDTKAKFLIFSIDEQLVQIPWELLHDGTNFISLKFAIGRSVRTKQKFYGTKYRSLSSPLKMLALCDPTGDLKSAYDEGITIRNELDRKKDKIKVDLKTTEIDKRYVKRNIRDYDIVHFAGHAEYNLKNPSQSGWILSNDKFTPEDIAEIGSAAPFPSLIFSNACQSGKTEEWNIEQGYEDKIYGLANAFLLAGVRHYIGTFWRVLDESCLLFSKEFYKHIANGVSIGEALRLSRIKLIEKYGETSIIWASYVLYGDPSISLFGVFTKEDIAQEPKLKKTKKLVTLVLLVLIIGVAILWKISYFHKNNVLSLSIYEINDLRSGAKDEMLEKEIISNLKSVDLGQLSIKDLGILLTPGKIKEVPLSNICKRFKVDVVVMGEYKQENNEVRGTIRFLDPLNGGVLQSRQIISKDILGFTEQATFSVIDMAKIKISEDSKYLIAKRPTDNLEAYLIFSRTWKLFLEGNNTEVIELCGRALELDPAYADAYKRLADAYDRLGKRDLALEYCLKYRDISKQKKDWKNLANSYLKIGLLTKGKDAYKEALECYDKALSMAKARGLLLEEAKSYNRIGVWHEEREAYDLALEYFIKAKKINEKHSGIYNHRYELAGNYLTIGLIYLDKGSPRHTDKGLKYTKKSLEIYKELGDLSGMACCYTNIGEGYRDKNMLDEAIAYYEMGLDIDIILGDYYGTGIDYDVLGEAYYQKQDYDKALYYFGKALEVRRKVGGAVTLSETLAHLGETYYKKRQFYKAVECLREALDVAKELERKRCMFDYEQVETLLKEAELARAK